MKKLIILAIIFSCGYYFWNDQKFEWPTDKKINQGISQIKGGLNQAQKIIEDPETEEEIKSRIALIKEKVGNVKLPVDIAGNIKNIQDNFSDLEEKIKNLDLGDDSEKNISKNKEKRTTQEAFLAVRGNPGIFMILFSDAKLDKTGKPVKREKILRVDSWTFGTPENKISEFENEFFTGEKNIPEKLELMNHKISPLSFKENTSLQDIKNRFGTPSCIVEIPAGKNILRTLKYEEKNNQPYITVMFSDEKIISVNVGITFVDTENRKLCP